MRSGDEQYDETSGDKARRKVTVLVVLLLVLLMFLLMGVLIATSRGRGRAGAGQAAGSAGTAAGDTAVIVLPDTGVADTAAAAGPGAGGTSRGDTAARVRFGARRSGGRPDSAGAHAAGADSARAADSTRAADSAAHAAAADSAGVGDTAAAVPPCSRDTVAPWVYPDPSGGLHRRAVNVALLADEPCRIEWRWAGEPQWRQYKGEWIVIERSSTIEYRGTDTCGNAMAPHEERYEIQRSGDTTRCPADMEFVSVAGTEFCIDRYEWPNRPKRRPSSYVSLYQAMDSCFAAGKRLCTSDEWKLACSGPYGWAYPYGERFEERACVTQDTGRAPSGAKAECRGYFDVYDMSGNLAEWTSTRSSANSRFYNVMGGFWESGSQSRCFDARYSYFPQNRHNPVGFRCCAEAARPGEPAAPGRSRR